jgi:quercetin dioxygenase-like cupin family protein
MDCTEITTGADGHSAFSALDVFEAEAVLFNGVSVSLSPPQPCESVLVHEFDEGYFMGWHNPPARQYVVVLEGELEISVQGKDTPRRFAAGSVFLAADLKGTGHTTHAIRSGRALVINAKG